MKPIPVVRANASVLPFIQFLDKIGAPTERFLKQANFPITALREPEALIPLPQAFAFSELAARAEGIEDLGIVVAQHTQVSQLGAFGAFLCQSMTLHDLLHRMLKLHNLVITAEQIWLTEEGDNLWFHHRYLIPPQVKTNQGQSYSILMYLEAIRLATGSTWQPDELHLSGQHRQRGFQELEFLGNTPIHFHQPTNAIRFSKALLSQPLIRSNSHPLLANAEETLKLNPPASDFMTSLRQVILLLLPDGYPNLATVAEAAGMSVRTFQRRLEENQLSYSQLVDQIRFERANELLKDPTHKLLDITFDLGYTDPANFSKAFKRWTGLSPREFRKLHLQQ